MHDEPNEFLVGAAPFAEHERDDWFPHPSPDGSKVLFLSYDEDVSGHPRDKQVRLRLMDADGGNVETLFELFGGQGSINVPNWSPDGSAFAFVRYFAVTD